MGNDLDDWQYLKNHWDEIQDEKQHKDFLILYPSKQTSDSYAYNSQHLKIFGQFEGHISAITTTSSKYLQTFDPRDPSLLDNLQKWINRTQSEQ